jgi:hypothetical protein
MKQTVTASPTVVLSLMKLGFSPDYDATLIIVRTDLARYNPVLAEV